MTNLAAHLLDTTERHGEHIALKLDETEISYASLDAASARVAGMLHQRGLTPGDRVGVMLPNVPYFVFVYYGILRAGGVVVPMNVLLKAREVEFGLTDSAAGRLFVWHGCADAAARRRSGGGRRRHRGGTRGVRGAAGTHGAGHRSGRRG